MKGVELLGNAMRKFKKKIAPFVPASKINYTAPETKAKPVPKPKKKPGKNPNQHTILQYGDKGYRPSTGKGVGH